MGKNNVKINIAADTAQAKQQINNFSKELNQSKRSVRDLTAAYEQLDDATKSSSIGKNMKKDLDSAIDKFKELQKIQEKVKKNLGEGIDTSGFKMPDIGSMITKSLDSAGFSGASSAIETLGGLMGGSLTAGAVAASAGVAAAGIAVKEFVDVSKEAIQKSAEFGQALSGLSAITGVQGTALDGLKSQIQDLGKETNSSVVDVTNGMAKIGGAMPQLLDDVDGLGEMFKQSSVLAKAGLMSQDEATQSLTTIMAQFNHTVTDSAKDVDILANASQAGSAEISDLAGTMKVAGVAANSAGLSLQQASAMAEVLGDNALKGSEAGTQLRNIFSKFSAEGIKDADTMMQTLAKHAGDTGWMVKQFGLDSANAAQMLASGGDRYKELLDALDQTGTATEMARTNFDNLNGDIAAMKTQWENFLSSFNVDAADGPVRELAQSMGELMQSVIDLVGEFQNSTTIQSAISAIGEQGSLLIDILTTVVNIVGDVLGVFFDLVDTSGSATTALDALTTAFKIVKEAIKMVEGVVFALRYAINWLLKQFADFKNYVMSGVSKIPLFETIKRYIDQAKKWVQSLIGWWSNLKKTIESTRQEMNKTNVTQGNKEKQTKGKKENKQPTNKTKNKTSNQNLPKADMSFGSGSSSKGKKSKSTKSEKNTTKTGKQDPIEQANKSYNETMQQLNGKLRDSMITQEEYDKKKKSVLESLIDSYYKAGKSKENSPELAKKIAELGKVKESIHTDDIQAADKELAKAIKSATDQYANNMLTDDEYDNKIIEAKKTMISKMLEIGNLTEDEKKTLASLISEVKAKQKSDMQKDLNKGVSDITKTDTSIADKFNFGTKHRDKADAKSQLDDLVKQFDDLTKERQEKSEAATKIGVQLDFSDLDKQRKELGSKIANMAKDAKKEANFESIFDGLNDVSNLASGIESIGHAFDDVKDPLDAFAKGIGVITEMMQMYKTVTEIVTVAQDLFSASTTAAATADTAATATEVANSTAKTTASSGEAIAGATASGAKMPFPLNLVAIAAGVAAVIAALASISGAFATGGIVGGSGATTTIGDNTLIRVNRGEMVLNNNQQAHLFKMLDGGLSLNTQSSGGSVNFKISGSNLYGTLKNYSSMQSKVGRNIGIH